MQPKSKPEKVLIAIPVFNEAAQLAQSIARLHSHLAAHCPFDFEIVIANNASTDRTLEIARQLQAKYSGLRVTHLNEKGRGRAVRQVWSESEADILTYMDVDLSTDLSAFNPLVEALASGGYDLAIGSRLLQPGLTTRSFRRETISRGYNRLVKAMFHTRFSDAQCGFKAITRAAARRLLPAIKDTGWFFDTELLVIAEKCGYRIFDLPVKWTEDNDSRVKILATAWADIRGLLRLRRNFRRGNYAGLVLKAVAHP